MQLATYATVTHTHAHTYTEIFSPLSIQTVRQQQQLQERQHSKHSKVVFVNISQIPEKQNNNDERKQQKKVRWENENKLRKKEEIETHK